MSDPQPSRPEEQEREATGEGDRDVETNVSDSPPSPADDPDPAPTSPAPADAAPDRTPPPVPSPEGEEGEEAVGVAVDEGRSPPAESAAGGGEATEREVEAADAAKAAGEESPAKPGEAPRKEKPKPRKKRERRGPPKPQRISLTAEQRMEARETARQRLLAAATRDESQARAALDIIESGRSLIYAGRFRRHATGGMDERQLRMLRDRREETLHEEERRVELTALLRSHGALDDKTRHRLERANSIAAMEDVAAPHLPVVAGRATVARSFGLEGLAKAIREAAEGSILSDLAQPFVKEGEGPSGLDGALAGARDILAEEITLDAELRARLRKIFRKEATLQAALRSERKGDSGAHKALVGYQAPATQVPPLKFLQVRRAEKERVIVATIEPPEESVLPLLHEAAAPEEHPHAGFIRAAAEDGYRRILKPLFQAEIRAELKRKADDAAVETFERNLRHRLMGPVGGPRAVLGLRPDVTGGHRWCAVDAEGLPAGSGTLPHEGTAGRQACLDELKEVVRTYEITAVAVGSGGGRGEALSLAEEAAGEGVDVTIVPDGGTHVLEAQGTLEIDDRPPVPAECRGAYSLGRRFQEPLAELVTIDPKALALGPHLHEVHQGHLRRLLDETVESCVAYVGVDPNHASVDLLARIPGFDRASATSFHLWRSEHGPLLHKAALAAVPGVGTAVAEQAVGFLKLSDAEDPRDRVQLHPEQYSLVEKMAQLVDADIPALFADPALRARVNLGRLETDETPLPLLKYVLYQVTAGADDPRLRFTNPIPPPEGLTLDTLQPGLMLEGRVVRAVPFGIFVDVGMGTDALIPNAHIGDHPGIEVTTVAPMGAVVQAHVLEVIPGKRRLTLSMRRERFSDRRGGPRQAYRRGGGGERSYGGGGRPLAGGPPSGEGGGRAGGRRERGTRRQERGDGPRQGGGGRPQPTKRRRGPPQGGKFSGGGISDIFDRRSRGRDQERGTPRTISLGPDDEAKKKGTQADEPEEKLTEEQLLQKKLDELRQKFGG